MKYVVIATFADLTDNKHLYAAGDTFPRRGLKVSDERIKELIGSDNKMHQPVIKEMENDPDRDMPTPEKLVRPESKKVSRKNKNQ